MSTTPNSMTNIYRAETNDFSPQRRPTWTLTLLFFGVLVSFLLLVGRSELSRWYYAAAKNAIEDGRYEDAVQAADRGLYWNPDYAELIVQRATANFQNGDFDACLRDYDRVIELYEADGTVNEFDIAAKARKAAVLHRMQRFSESLALMSEIVEYRKEQFRLRDDWESQYQYAMALNNRAYSEAQAFTKGSEVDIKKSLQDIKLAMEVRGVADDPVMVDTLGYLLLLNEDPQEALYQLDMAVKLTQQNNEVVRQRYQEQMRTASDQRPLQQALEEMDQQFSIILHHRGEAYAANGEAEKSHADIQEAKRLGYDPDNGIW